MLLKPVSDPGPRRAAKRLEAVFIILIVENVFDRPVNPDRLLLVFKRESIARRQIALSVSLEAINVGIESRVTKDRREIGAGLEDIEVEPERCASLRGNA